VTGSPRLVSVRLVANEEIVPRGTARKTWLVHSEGRWVSARDVAGAELTRIDPTPGVVWQTVAVVTVHVGTWLLCIRSRPISGAYRDPMRYLDQEVRRARAHVRRDYFRAGPHGKLVRPTPDQEPPPDSDLANDQ